MTLPRDRGRFRGQPGAPRAGGWLCLVVAAATLMASPAFAHGDDDPAAEGDSPAAAADEHEHAHQHEHQHDERPEHEHGHTHEHEAGGEHEAAASPAHAHAPAEAPATEGPEAPKEPILVTVRGAPPPRTASQVTRDRRVLRSAPHRTASDLLMTVPGAFVTQHSGEGKAHQIFFRGFDAVHGQDIELWVGGAPVNEVSNIHGQGYADLHFAMPEVIREVRAYPGPFSPRQGDFAVAGSMHMELGWDRPGLTAKGTYGSFNTQRLFLAYRPPTMSEDTFAAVEIYESDGFGVGRASNRASAVAQWAYAFSRSVQLRLMTSTYAGRFGSAGVVRQDDVRRGAIDRFGSYDTAQGGHSSRSQVVVDLYGEYEGYRFRLAPFVVHRALELRSNFTGFLVNPTAGDSIQQINDATTIGARGYLHKHLNILSELDSLELGFYARNDWIDQSARTRSVLDGSVQSTEVDAEVRGVNVAGYVDAAVRPLRRLVVRGGARVDGLSFATRDEVQGGAARSSQGTHVGLKGTADVAIVPGLHGLLSFGQGFRSPQARSLGNGEQTPFTTVESVELGVRYRDRKRLRASASVFRTTLSDDLVFNEARNRNEAVPATTRLGVVADMVAQPTSWFSSSLGGTYVRATFDESNARGEAGDLVPFVPQLVVRSDLAYTPSFGKVGGRELTGRVGLGLTYLFGRPIPFGETGSNIFLADVRLRARWKEVQLGLDVLNVLDVGWNDGEFVYASNFQQNSTPSLIPARHITAGSPRTVLLSLTLTL